MPNLPVNNLGELYLQGCTLSWEFNGDRNLVNLSVGQVRSDDNTNDIVIDAPLSINISNNGPNGLDVGASIPQRFYDVYVIGDSTGFNPGAGLLALNNTTPKLPFGYDLKRRVGYVNSAADPTGTIYNFYQRGTGKDRTFSTSLFTPLVGGTAAVFTDIDLSTTLPAITTGWLSLTATITPTLAGDTAQFAIGSTPIFPGTIISGSVAGLAQTMQVTVPLGQAPSGGPGIMYKVDGSLSFTMDSFTASF